MNIKPTLSCRKIGLFGGICLLAGNLACTSTTVNVRFAAPAPRVKPRVLVVGEFRHSDSKLERDLFYFKRGLLRRLEEDGVFFKVETQPGTSVPEDGIRLTGVISLVDSGSAVGRLCVGFGLGEARVKGTFALYDPEGEAQAEFTASRKYKGGAGIGGRDFLYAGDLLTLLGETVAEVVTSWAEGESID